MLRLRLLSLSIFIVSFFLAEFLHAQNPCDGFHINFKNKLTQDLQIKNLEVINASIEPVTVNKIEKKNNHLFHIYDSHPSQPITVAVSFSTMSLPDQNLTLFFKLTNKGMFCTHDERGQEGNLKAKARRFPNRVSYSID